MEILALTKSILVYHLHRVFHGDVDVVWHSRIQIVVVVADELVLPILLLRSVVVVHGIQAEHGAIESQNNLKFEN